MYKTLRPPVLGSIPKIQHDAQRGPRVAFHEMFLGRVDSPLVRENMLEGVVLEGQTLPFGLHAREKILDLLRFGGFRKRPPANCRQQLRNSIVVSNRHHALHHAHLTFFCDSEEVLALVPPPRRRLWNVGRHSRPEIPSGQTLPFPSLKATLPPDMGWRRLVWQTVGILVNPSGSSCALAERPRRRRRLFKLNKSFLMIPVDGRMQHA